MVQAAEETEQQDLPQAFRLLNEMNSNVLQVTQLVDNMLVKVKNGQLSTDKGLSFLEMKYHMLLSYLINLTFIVLRKCSGEKIEGDPAIDRLIDIRTVLEKIRPIDTKLKYQIDKLVKSAASGEATGNDPSVFKARPENLVSKIQDNEDDDDSDVSDDEQAGSSEKVVKTGLYVPPKLAAVHYEGDETRKDKEKRLEEKNRKRNLNSSVMRELQEEYLDTPIEVSSGMKSQQAASKFQQEKTEYEENYLTRLPLTKAEKHRQKKMTTIGTLGDEITRFGDYGLDESGASKSKKRKRKSGAKKGKNSKRRRFH